MASGKLSDYAQKRAFGATPEPAPVVPDRLHGPLLFVVQQHAARQLHWDLRLELDGVLKSWAVPKGPSLDRREKRLAMLTEDHPFAYAAFEGVIPKGEYGAGGMIVWDVGVYSPDEDGLWFHDREEAQRQLREAFAAGKLSIELRGEKLKGSFALVRMKDAKSWILLKHQDRFVSEADVTARDRSVLSGTSIDRIDEAAAHGVAATRLAPEGPREKLPTKLAPMLADSTDAPATRPGWWWEPKLDGYRVIASVGGGIITLRSRRGLDLTPAFPDLVAALAAQNVDGLVLDGEIVALDADGRPSFAALQQRVQLDHARTRAAADRATPVVYFAFDLLHFAGLDLRGARYDERRRWLAQCLMPSPLVQRVHASADGHAMLDASLASGFEGAVGKRGDSRYEPGKRSAAWLKVKPVTSGEFVIGGYTRGRASRASLGALLVGTYARGKLVYASHVGSGFDDRTLTALTRKLAPLVTKACPFTEKPVLNAPATWVTPTLVAEIEYHSITADGALRAPVFLRLRDDVAPKSVKLARATKPAPDDAGERDVVADVLRQLDGPRQAFELAVGEHRVRLTHLDRIYWPAEPGAKRTARTKRDLLRYLARVSGHMLPHLADRPLTMIRMPDGIGGQRFFQKHWEQARPDFVDAMTVWSEHKDESHEYLVCNNLSTLLWLGQSGTLEFHVWHSRATLGDDAISNTTDYATSRETLEASVLNYPDYVVFDIDPYIYSGQEAKGAEPELNTVAFEKGKEVAFRLREVLKTMGLDAIVKTSGKTGLHVFVPIRRTIDFDAARATSELVGRHLMRLYPKDITLEWSVPKRTGKIFMDYNMNVRGKTLNVAYSPRGEPAAPISMPLTWAELERAHPHQFRLDNAAEVLAGREDRWADALQRKQDLQDLLAKR